jgi:Zn-dependent peptidase ImmA (M78 family)/DNA-binding XRE family transcriptional regulator
MSNIGERLKSARVAAGLSLRDLAEKAAPLSATAISKYERGDDTPRPATLLRLARALDQQAAYFLRQTTVTVECPRYRKNSRFGVKAQEAVQAQVRDRLERYLDIEAVFSPGRFPPPALRPEDRRGIRTLDEAEELAREVRHRWDLGTDPIENVPEVLEDHGVKVLLIHAPEGFDGLSCWANQTIPVVVANAAKTWDRQRFDFAHEVGELLMDAGSGVDQEKAAHRFAGAFLAPRDAVMRELGAKRAALDLEELRILKAKYGLSMQGWVRRALDAGVISQAYYERWFIQFSRLGLRKDERTGARPADRAHRFELLVHQAEAEGLITPSRRAQLLGEAPAPAKPLPSREDLARAVAESTAMYDDEDARAWSTLAGETLEDE